MPTEVREYCRYYKDTKFQFAIANIFFIYFKERKNNPEEFPRDFIPGFWQGFWWALVTMTTVGYVCELNLTLQ